MNLMAGSRLAVREGVEIIAVDAVRVTRIQHCGVTAEETLCMTSLMARYCRKTL